MKYIITLFASLITFTINAQKVNSTQQLGFRLGTGISTMLDQLDPEIIQPGGWTKEVSVYNVRDFPRYGLRWEVMWTQETLLHTPTDGKLQLNYFNVSVAPSLRSKNKIHRGYAGLYGGVLAQRSFRSPVTNSTYNFNPFDLGLVLGYELSLYSRVKIDARIRQGITSTYNNKRGLYALTSYQSNWLGNFNMTIGVIVVLYKSERLKKGLE